MEVDEMNSVNKLIKELCPSGVEYKPLWSLTYWDKKFNAVDKAKQKKVFKYHYFLAADLKELETENGDVKILTTSQTDLWTTIEKASDFIAEGEIVCIPWGGNPIVQYYKGKFVTGDNRIATSIDKNVLDNKFLYYYLQNNLSLISTFYRGSGIKHPDMAKVLDIEIPIPPIKIQEEIVRLLDDFYELVSSLKIKLQDELCERTKQYRFYQKKLLSFDAETEFKSLGVVCDLSSGGDVPKGHWDKEKTDKYSIPIYSNGVELEGLYGYTDTARISTPAVTIAGRGAGVGNAFIRREPYFPIIRLVSAVPKEGLDVDYLYHCIKQIEFKIPQGGIPQLTVPMVSAYEIPVPDIDIQKKVAKNLNEYEQLMTDFQNEILIEIDARERQYASYRNKLLNFTKVGE